MRDYAKGKPGFWTGNFGDLIRGDPECQSLGWYLITCPHSNMIGLYRLPVSYMIEDLGWDPAPALVKLVDFGFCRYDPRHRAVWVIEAARIEWGNRPNVKDKRVISLQRMAPKILDSLNRSELVPAFLERYLPGWEQVLGPWQALNKPLASPAEVRPEALAMQEQEQESDQESESEQEKEIEEGSSSPPPHPAGGAQELRNLKEVMPDVRRDTGEGPNVASAAHASSNPGEGGRKEEPPGCDGSTSPADQEPGIDLAGQRGEGAGSSPAGGTTRAATHVDREVAESGESPKAHARGARLSSSQEEMRQVLAVITELGEEPPRIVRGKEKGQPRYSAMRQWLKTCGGDLEILERCLAKLSASAKWGKWGYLAEVLPDWAAKANGAGQQPGGGSLGRLGPEDLAEAEEIGI